ncbi:MAG: CHAT domain-containing protein [Flammeovirgaceae bacterium]
MKLLSTCLLCLVIISFKIECKPNKQDSVRWYTDKYVTVLAEKGWDQAYPYILRAKQLADQHANTKHYLTVLLHYIEAIKKLHITIDELNPLLEELYRIAQRNPSEYHSYIEFYWGFKLRQAMELHQFVEAQEYVNELVNYYNRYGTVQEQLHANYLQLDYYITSSQLHKADSLKAYLDREVRPFIKDLNALLSSEAFYYEKHGDIAQAIKTHKEVVKLEMLNRNTEAAHRTNTRIGQLYHLVGEYRQALAYYNKAIPYFRASLGDNHPQISKEYNRVGEVYRQVGEYEKALSYYKEAYRLSVQRFGAINFRAGSVCNNLGETYYALGQYESALMWHQKSLTIRKQIEYHPYLTNSYDNLGATYTKLGDFKNAQKYLFKALEMRENMPDNSLYSIYRMKSYLHLSEYYAALGDYEQAVIYHQKGVDKNMSNFRFDETAKYQFMNKKAQTLLFSLHQLADARQAFEQAIALNVPNYDRMHQVELVIENCYNPLSLFESLYGKATVLQREGLERNERSILQESLQTFYLADQVVDFIRRRYTTQKDKVRLGKLLHAFYEEANTTSWALYQMKQDESYWNDLFYFSERSKAGVLADVQQTRKAKQFAHLPDSILNKEREYSSLISFYQQKILDGKSPAKFQKKLIDTQHKFTKFIHELERAYPEYHQLRYAQAPISISAVQQSLDEDETFVEYFFLRGKPLAFIIDKQQFTVESLKEVHPQQVHNFRNALLHRKWQQYTTEAYALYNILIKPLTKKLTTTKLTIVPDRHLWYVNFDLLLTAPSTSQVYKNQPYLIYEYAIRYLYAAQLALENEKEDVHRVNNKLIAFAPSYATLNADSNALNNINQKFRGEVGELLWSDDEVRSIADEWKGEAYYGKEASEKVFKDRFKDGKILHLAMHALLDDQHPERSRLVFTYTDDSLEDDLLNVYELYNMEFDAELAVLSACNTGVGKLEGGEGMMSLGRAFAYAGCPAVVMSQWKVDDRATSLIMEEFYQLLDDGLAKSLALRTAKLNYLEQAGPQEANPFLWGSFIVVGDNHPLNQPTYWEWMALCIGIAVVVGFAWYLRKR